MTDKHYVKLTLIVERCFEIKADSPDNARIKVNDIIDDELGCSINGWELIDYNIEVEDQEE